MGWNGSGDFSRSHNFSADASAGIKILASRVDAEFDNFETGLETALTRDGQNSPSGNLPMAGYRHTNVGVATSTTQYLRADQYTLQTPIFGRFAGTAEAMSVSTDVALSTLAAGYTVIVSCPSVNVTTSITLAVNGTSAYPVVRADGLGPGRGQTQGMHRYTFNGTNWVLLDPLPMNRWWTRARFTPATGQSLPGSGQLVSFNGTGSMRVAGQYSTFFTSASASTLCAIPGGVRQVGIHTNLRVVATGVTASAGFMSLDVTSAPGAGDVSQERVSFSFGAAGSYGIAVTTPVVSVYEGLRVQQYYNMDASCTTQEFEITIWAID